MTLSYDQENETITLLRKENVIYRASGKAAAIAFVAIEMGRSTNIYHKLVEGVDEEVISLSHYIQSSIQKYERLYSRESD